MVSTKVLRLPTHLHMHVFYVYALIHTHKCTHQQRYARAHVQPSFYQLPRLKLWISKLIAVEVR